MGKKKALMCVDIETIDMLYGGKVLPKTIFNIGYLIGDIQGNVLEKANIIVESIYRLPPHNIHKYYYAKNLTPEMYDVSVKALDCNDALKIFNDKVAEYSKKYDLELWSYNAQFDKSGIELMAERKNISYKAPDKWYDILELFVNTIGNTVTYKQWLIEKEYEAVMNRKTLFEHITAKGNYRCRAQNAYQFLIKDENFIEAHIGMQDCEIEYQILLACRDIDKKLKPKPRCCLAVLRKVNPKMRQGQFLEEVVEGTLFDDMDVLPVSYFDMAKEIVPTRSK